MDYDPGAVAAATTSLLRNTFIPMVFTACQFRDAEPVSEISITPTYPEIRIEKISPAPIKKQKKMVYITFDDGPNKGSRKVMHIIEEEKVPVTFFIVGQHVYGSTFQKETMDSILACEDIECCNHSFSHAHNRYADYYAEPDSVVNDFERSNDSLHFKNNIARTPGRNIWRTSSVTSTDVKKSSAAGDSLQNSKFTLIGWDLEWHFDKDMKLKQDPDSLISEIDSLFARGKTKTVGHLVLLAHDQSFQDEADSSSLHVFISKLKKKEDYQMEFISKYPK